MNNALRKIAIQVLMSNLTSSKHDKTANRISCLIFTGERTPQASDRQEMHSTMSALTEILRTDIAMMTASHYTTEDTVVCGHTIPKGMIS